MSGKKTEVEIDLDEDTVDQEAEEVVVETAAAIEADDSEDIVDEDINPLDKLPDHAVQNDDGSITLPLTYPQTVKTKKGGKISDRHFKELCFHRLNGADTRAISAASDESQPVVTFARSTRMNQAVMNALFDKLDASDIAFGGRVINHFLTPGPKTPQR